MEKRFDETIKEKKFTIFEMAGFAKEPVLALKAGMALGYSMACDDHKDLLKRIKAELGKILQHGNTELHNKNNYRKNTGGAK